MTLAWHDRNPERWAKNSKKSFAKYYEKNRNAILNNAKIKYAKKKSQEIPHVH